MPTARGIGLGLVGLGLGIGALVPIFVAIYPAAGIAPADARTPEIVLPVIASNPALVMIPGALEIIVHAIGIVALLGFWARFGATSFLLLAATLFGLVWLSVDLIDNAITYRLVPNLAGDYATGSATAGAAFVTLTNVVEAIRLGAHLAGGLWMIAVSTFVVRTRTFPAVIGWLGVAVGAIFAANLPVPALMNLSFLTVPAWLVFFGIIVARAETAAAPMMLPRVAEA